MTVSLADLFVFAALFTVAGWLSKAWFEGYCAKRLDAKSMRRHQSTRDALPARIYKHPVWPPQYATAEGERLADAAMDLVCEQDRAAGLY